MHSCHCFSASAVTNGPGGKTGTEHGRKMTASKNTAVDGKDEPTNQTESKEAVEVSGGYVEMQGGRDELQFEVTGRNVDGNERRDPLREVSIKLKTPHEVLEEFSVVTSIDPKKARDLADQLLEAADYADGEVSE